MGHIVLSRSADLVVVAPATADLIAKMAAGLANDLATTALIATDKPVLIAPAMNVKMWEHSATQRNIATLKADGIAVVGPNAGELADGECGPAGSRSLRRSSPRSRQCLREHAALWIEGARHGGPDARADRSGALHREPLVRQTGLCDRIGAR